MLKRPRGDSIPPLPQLSHDLTLDVFTHKSLRRESARVEEYGDNERLSVLGEAVLRATITLALFNRRPMLLSKEFTFRCELATSSENVAKWAELYNMKRRLRCDPAVMASMNILQEGVLTFQAFVGAVYEEHGQQAVTEWITRLLQLEEDPSEVTYVIQSATTKESPPPKKLKGKEDFIPLGSPGPGNQKTNQYAFGTPTPAWSGPQGVYDVKQSKSIPPNYSMYPTLPTQVYTQTSSSVYRPPQSSSVLMKQYLAQAPMHPSTQLPPPSFNNPLAPAQPNLPFLPLFNQTAAQRKVSVEYPAAFTGPAHAGQWNVQCVVNGIVKGYGRGNSKQVAKEDAARQAFYAMGWT